MIKIIIAKEKENVYEIHLEGSFSSNDFKKNIDIIKSIPGRKFNTVDNKSFWTIPLNQIDSLKNLIKDLVVQEDISQHDLFLKDIPTDISYLNEWLLTPYPFQILGINFLASMNGAIIGDDMGSNSLALLYSNM